MPNEIEITERWFSLNDCAIALGVHVHTVRRLCHSGRLPYTRVGKLIRISKSDLSAFAKRNRVATVGA